MTCYPFGKKKQPNVLDCRGWTKASTGYTFKIDKKSTQLVAFLQEEKDL
jgi:hypothetical protein